MKATSALLLSLLCLGFSPAWSKDFKFPQKGATLFTIAIPDSWSPEYDDEGTLEAEDKGENAYFALWEEDANTDLAKIAEDVDEILDEYAKDVKLEDKPTPYKLGDTGLEGLWFKGTARDKEDGSGIGFEALVLMVDKDTVAVFFYDYGQDAPEKVTHQLVEMLKSVKTAK